MTLNTWLKIGEITETLQPQNLTEAKRLLKKRVEIKKKKSQRRETYVGISYKCTMDCENSEHKCSRVRASRNIGR